MEDDLTQNRRRPNTEDDPTWKTTQHGRRPNMEDNPTWKTTKNEDDQEWKRPRMKTTKNEDDQMLSKVLRFSIMLFFIETFPKIGDWNILLMNTSLVTPVTPPLVMVVFIFGRLPFWSSSILGEVVFHFGVVRGRLHLWVLVFHIYLACLVRNDDKSY